MFKKFLITMSAVLQMGLAAESNRVAVLEIEVQNSVTYRYDDSDVTKRAGSQVPVTPSIDRAFIDFCQIDDIVAVNGKPAKGLHMTCGTRMGFNPNPRPGFGIADVALGAGRQECNWEIYSAEGRFIGRFVDGGVFPHSVQGGAGAYFGATGENHFSGASGRLTSVTEDPSLRRVNGGTSYKVYFYVIPKYWPEVVVGTAGPAVFRDGDTSLPVSSERPARSGEVLTLIAKGLGPTLPGISGPTPAGTRLFASVEPWDQVSSPLDVTINGMAAEVINSIGWPGTADMYRVDFRVPSGVTPGVAKLRLTSAWIPSDEVENCSSIVRDRPVQRAGLFGGGPLTKAVGYVIDTMPTLLKAAADPYRKTVFRTRARTCCPYAAPCVGALRYRPRPHGVAGSGGAASGSCAN